MNNRKQLFLQLAISDVLLELRPLSILFPNKNPDIYSLYLEKGMQVIGKVNESIHQRQKQKLFRFKSDSVIPFRVNHVGATTYSWNLYKVDQKTKEEYFLQSVNFSIVNQIQEYMQELSSVEKDIISLNKQKGVTTSLIFDRWKQAKIKFRSQKNQRKCQFNSSTNIHLEFSLEIKSNIDVELQLYTQAEERKTLRKFRSEENMSSESQNVSIDLSAASEPLRTLHEMNGPILDTKTKILGEEEGGETEIKIMSPQGYHLTDQIKEQDGEVVAVSRSKPKYNERNKQLSLLSDIIERSHEGSSSYGADKEKTNKTPIQDMEVPNIISQKENQKPAYNKIRTLQPDTKPLLDYRRTFTNQKQQPTQLQRQRITEEELEDQIEKYSPKQKIAKGTHNSNTYAKIYFIIAFIFIAIIFESILCCKEQSKEWRKNMKARNRSKK